MIDYFKQASGVQCYFCHQVMGTLTQVLNYEVPGVELIESNSWHCYWAHTQCQKDREVMESIAKAGVQG